MLTLCIPLQLTCSPSVPASPDFPNGPRGPYDHGSIVNIDTVVTVLQQLFDNANQNCKQDLRMQLLLSQEASYLSTTDDLVHTKIQRLVRPTACVVVLPFHESYFFT